jgi:hypothetical protein
MGSKFNFVADTMIRDKAYPALAEWSARPYTAEWRQFVQHWPHTVPVELHEHCVTHSFPYQLKTTKESYTWHDFYTIGLGFFNFNIDYVELLSSDIIRALQQLNLRLLFYYHEGDNPHLIKKRLDSLCAQHNLSTDCYRFVSGNTAADSIENFAWFPDHELLYWHRNHKVVPRTVDLTLRPYDFTLLSRTHKWWRATVVTDLHRARLLDCSQWSYNTVDIGDLEQDNPIEIDSFDRLRDDVHTFLAHAPYTCDAQTSDQHNNHHMTETMHYTDSYFNIVLETHFDADGSGGAFLTEKTFKPIKHAQPFVIVGAPGSLQALRSLGYRTFDHAIDNSYDTIQNNTQRWIAVKSTIEQIKQNPAKYFAQCRDDVIHNQQLFLSSKYNRLNRLLERLNK